MEKSSSIFTLNDQLYSEIIAFLSPNDFLNLSLVSKFFHSYLSNGTTWKAYMARLGPNALVSCANLQVQPSSSFKFVKFAMKVFYSKQSDKFGVPLTLIPIESSTLDFDQSIHNVINPQHNTFWSSAGNASEDSEESLLFLFSKYLVIPTVVTVTFFTAVGVYEEGTLEFPCKQVAVEFSIDGIQWEYGSDIVNVNGGHQVEVKLKGKTGLARYMRIRLFGKTVLQPTDNLYYVAVESVKCLGYQLDCQDKENQHANELIISSWITWQIQEIMYGEKGGQKDRGKEIVDYYSTQEFSEDVYTRLKELLDSKDNEAIWEYLEGNKFLLGTERTFVEIFERYQEFGVYYYDKVVNEKKRQALNHHEALLLMLMYVSITGIDDHNPNLTEVLRAKYECGSLNLILYMNVSKHTFEMINELTGKGNLQSLETLGANNTLLNQPADVSAHLAGLILLLYLSRLTFV